MWGDNIKNAIIAVALLLVITLACVSVTSAQSSFMASFNQHYDTYDTKLDSCDVCHAGPNGGSLDPYGLAYSRSGRNFASIEDRDSDGDGFTNLEEIDALTFPGDSSDSPEIIAESISEPITSETNMVDDESVEDYDTSEETEIEEEENEIEEEETEIEEVETEIEIEAKEPTSETATDTQSPGFEVIFAVVGILSIAYLKRRR